MLNPVHRIFPLHAALLMAALFLVPIPFPMVHAGEEPVSASLIPEERAWIETHVVKVGIEEWPPITMLREDGKAGGLAGGYLDLIRKKTGMRFKFVGDLWDPLLKGLRARRIDLLPATYYTDERATYGLYTKPYFHMREFVYVRSDKTTVKRIDDLKDERIAVVKGYGTIPKLKAKYPNATIVETVDLMHSINAVLNGEVDALMEAQMAVELAINSNAIIGLKGISQDVFPSSPIHFFSRIDEPLLNSILQKGLDAITEVEHAKEMGKWISTGITERPRDSGAMERAARDTDPMWVLLVVAFVVFVSMLGAAYLLPRVLSDEVIAALVGSTRFRIAVIGLTSAVAFVVLALVWFAVDQNRQWAVERIERDLRYVIGTTSERLDDWVEDRRGNLTRLGRDPELLAITRQLLSLPSDAGVLRVASAQQRARDFFGSRSLEFGSVGFFIINPERISIGSHRDSNLGITTLIAQQAPELLKRAFEGETVFVPAIRSDVTIEAGVRGARLPSVFSMFFAAPIKDRDGNVLAVLTQRLLPGGRLSRLMQHGGVGQSGESYLVNLDGNMITESRFIAELERIGLVGSDGKGTGLLALRDPGGNLIEGFEPIQPKEEQPLTGMAQMLIQKAHDPDANGLSREGRMHSNFEGYRDYRGVPVFGVGFWDFKHGLGLVTEIDVSEAMAHFDAMRGQLFIVATVMLLLAVSTSLLTVTVGQRATRFMRRANDELEGKVEERTAELREREERLWDLYENAPVAYASLSFQGGFLKHNRAFAELLQHPRDGFDSLCWHDISSESDEILAAALEGRVLLDHELSVPLASGEILFASLSALPIKGDSDEVSEVRVTMMDITERRAAQERFAALMESAPDAMIVVDHNGMLVLVNSQVEQVFGFSREELLGEKIEILVPEEIRESHVGYRDGYLTNPSPQLTRTALELKGQRKDGSLFPAEVSLSPIETDEGMLVVAVVRDITQRKADEVRIARTNRDLSTLTLINEAVMESLTETQLLHDVCRILVETNGRRMAWIGYEQRGGDKAIGVEAHYGYEKGFIQQLPLSWDEVKAGHCPCGRVIRTARPVQLADIATDPMAETWREAALERDYHSLIAVPLSQHGDAFGALSVYSEESGEADQERVELLERLADNVAHGILALRSEAARQTAEVELSIAEERSRLLLHSAGEGIFGVDGHGHLTFVNPAVEKMLGYSHEELIGQRVHALIHYSHADGSDYPVENCPMYAAYTRGESHHIDDEVLWRKDGTSFEVEYSSVPIHKDEELVGAVITFRDITERREAESKMRAVWDNSGDGYLWLDPEFRFIGCNPAALELLGCSSDAELLGKTPLDFSPELQPDGTPSAERAALYASQASVSESQRFEYYHHKLDGSPFWSEITLARLIVQGEPLFLGIWHDVTVEREARVALERAKAAAEEATKAKSDFLANMSHEIRTPMNAIIGMSNLALKTELNSKQRNYVEKVSRSAESLLGIINDILDFSKIEAGKMDMETIDFRMEEVMDNLANLVGLKAEEKGVELLFDTAPDVPMALVGDPLRLGQIMVNLGNNAVKFTDEGEIVVITRVKAISDESVTLHIKVRDSGIGMTPEQCGKLFQSFSQADSSTTRKYGGTGLGLTISKRLTEMMGGEIWAESEAGKGSTFQFTATFGRQSGEKAGRVKPELPELQGLRVLVVDDNATAREILVDILKSFDFKVRGVHSGKEALEAIDSGASYDLILMDWMMPRMDGVETTRRIQERLGPSPQGAPPVIMVTAYGREEATEASAGVAFNGILSKPVSSSRLLDAIMEAFGHEVESVSRGGHHAEEELEAAAKVRGARVLLVEDNEINQELALELLANGRMIAQVAANGQEALERLEQETFDGVLMDCQMPVMDGYEATREIRKQAKYKDLPVIAMTANVMAGDREKVMDAGMNDHIGKPINVREMFTTMARWITPGEQVEEAAAPPSAVEEVVGLEVPELEGVDTRTGLAIAQGNVKLYRKLLGKFRDSQRDFETQFRAALAGDDASAPERTAHTLKGVAGNVGAKGVHEAAKALEANCKEGVEGLDELLAGVVSELQPVITALDELDRPADGDTSVRGELDLPKIEALLEPLRAMLKEDDTGATEAIDELAPLFAGTPHAEPLKAVAASVDEYDFEAALVALGELRTSLGGRS